MGLHYDGQSGLRMKPEAPVSGELGSLRVRLAVDDEDLFAIQTLRQEVFRPQPGDSPIDRPAFDQDQYDHYCDHLLVTDLHRDAETGPFPIVGTYRLLRQEIAEHHCGFYSSNEFDVSALVSRHPHKRFLELGRSCVRPTHRAKRTIELLWHGTWSYILHHRCDVLFGCASFPSPDPTQFSEALGYLHRFHLAEKPWQAPACGPISYDLAASQCSTANPRRAARMLPPLIKGYLRLGAKVGPQAVVDERFGTTDIFIVLPVSRINPKYVSYYGTNAERHRTV